tara:strand:- start:22526 stop:25753 length:3228 start_codon:yes stop_codon:yes gene_type:complete
MGKQIKRSEIAEQDLYLEIRDSAEKTLTQINALNDSLSKTATTLKTKLEKPLEATVNSISEVNKSTLTMNDTMEASIKLDHAKNKIILTQIEAETKLEKLAQEQIKTQIQENKLAKEDLKNTKKQNKQDKESEKLKKQLLELEDKQVIAKIKFQKANTSQKKILTDELILNSKNAGTLEKLSASMRKLRREREKLNLETVEGKTRLKEINDELDDNNEIIKENSDALKKQKQNVGNYTESIQEATGELSGMIGQIRDSIKGIKNQAKAFMLQAKAADSASKKIKLVGKTMKALGIGAIIALISSLVSSVSDTRSGVLAMEGTMKKFSASIKMLGNKAMDFFEGIKLSIESALLGLDEFKMKVMDFKMPDLLGGAKPFAGFFDIDVKATKKRIGEIEKRQKELANKNYDISGSFGNIDKAIIEQFKYENAIAKTSEEIEKLIGEEEILSEKTGDMTLSYKDQMKAQKDFNKIVEKRVGLEKDLAEDNTDLQALKIKQSLMDAGKQYTVEQIKSLKFLENESEWMAINSDALAELSNAKVEEIAKENELSTLKEKNAMEARNTAKDLFEKELDYAIDAFDVQKTINERIINNEKTTLKERVALTEETRRLADSSYKNQVKLVQDYTGEKVEFDKILKMTDEEEIRRTLKKFNLNETVLTRTLEILKERKIVVQDLADLEDETGKKRIEKDQQISDSILSINQDNIDLKIEQAEAQFEIEKDLREQSFEDEKIEGQETIKQLKKRIDNIKNLKIKQLKEQAKSEKDQAKIEIVEEDQKAQKIKEINNKLKNDIIRIEDETLKSKKEIDEAEIESESEKEEKILEINSKRKDDQIAILQGLTEIVNHFADKRIAKIDEEIEASQKKYDSLEEMAINGNILAKESMAEEAKLLADQNRKKEQMEKRKQRIQLASTVLQSYLTNSQDPKIKNPLQKTITDTVLLTEFIKTLSFFDGTEDTGTNGQGVDGKGGFHAILHPNERVIPKKNNDIIGNMSNDDLSQLAYNYQNGLVRDVADGLTLSKDMSGVNVLVDKLDSLERTINNKPEHNIQVEQIIDGAMAITRSVKKGNTKIYNRYRVGK